MSEKTKKIIYWVLTGLVAFIFLGSAMGKIMADEKAIEMASELQALGGNIGALGDPFQLMFKARNDFEGFAKDIGKASAEFVKYNEETKTFDITGGLARDRMKEIDIHSWSRGGVDKDTINDDDDDFGFSKEKIRGKVDDFGARYRLI